MAKKIPLPSDQSIIISAVNTLESMRRTIENDAVFADIDPREKEVFILSLKRATACAKNIHISLI